MGIWCWKKQAPEGLNMDESVIGGEVTQIEFDQMWHFILSKKETLAYQSA
jgi:hypothetical protein